MAERLLIELKDDIHFEHGAWHPSDDGVRALTDALAGCCQAAQRAFSRAAAALDRERVAIGHPADLPDLNKFYVVEGDRVIISGAELVADVTRAEVAPDAAPPDDLPDGAHTVSATGRLLCDEIDHAACGLGEDDLLVIPAPVSGRAAWAAAEIAARRGVHVVALAGGEVPPWVKRVTVVVPGELGAAARRLWAREGKGRRVRVTLESLRLVSGGDRGDSELYLEGWIEDARERTPLRVPSTGAIRHVEKGGSPVDLRVVVHEGTRRDDGDLIVHLEVWENDLGRDSLVDPDDLIGTIHARFSEEERWGEGIHTRHTQDGDGDCEVTFNIELLHGTA